MSDIFLDTFMSVVAAACVIVLVAVFCYYLFRSAKLSIQWLITLVSTSKHSPTRVQSVDFTAIRSQQQLIEPGRPPRLAEYTLFLFLSGRDRINMIGDLEEEYRYLEVKFGRRAARIWYFKQVITSIGPQLRRAVFRWVSIAWIEEWVRRHL